MAEMIKSLTIHKINHPKNVDTVQDEVNNETRMEYTAYDDKGNILESIRYDEIGEVEEKIVRCFDDEGNLIEETNFYSEDDISYRNEFFYNDSGKTIRILKHYADGEVDTTKIVRNEKQEVLEEVTTNSDDEVEGKVLYEYENNNLVRKTAFDYIEKVSEETFIYNDEGKLVEKDKWGDNDQGYTTKTFLNEKGLVEKVLWYDLKNNLIFKAIQEYNDKENVSKVVEESLRGTNITFIDFDENGNAVSQREETDGGDLNNKVVRRFNDKGQVSQAEVFIDHHNQAPNQHYVLVYKYEYFN